MWFINRCLVIVFENLWLAFPLSTFNLNVYYFDKLIVTWSQILIHECAISSIKNCRDLLNGCYFYYCHPCVLIRGEQIFYMSNFFYSNCQWSDFGIFFFTMSSFSSLLYYNLIFIIIILWIGDSWLHSLEDSIISIFWSRLFIFRLVCYTACRHSDNEGLEIC